MKCQTSYMQTEELIKYSTQIIIKQLYSNPIVDGLNEALVLEKLCNRFIEFYEYIKEEPEFLDCFEKYCHKLRKFLDGNEYCKKEPYFREISRLTTLIELSEKIDKTSKYGHTHFVNTVGDDDVVKNLRVYLYLLKCYVTYGTLRTFFVKDINKLITDYIYHERTFPKK